MKLPVLISVPHAGLKVPPEVADACILEERQIARDGDEGAAEIYDFAQEVHSLVRADVARAVVDLNRAPDDRRADGVVKTHTCFNEPVYREPLSEPVIGQLLRRYYYPFHGRLSEVSPEAVLGVDCHTMLAEAPPIGPDAGERRPPICLSNADGTCSDRILRGLASCLEESFGVPVSLNAPFKGGYVIRSHARERPWVQLELSRAPFCSAAEKRDRVLAALRLWCEARA